jgi:hypothetical protein
MVAWQASCLGDIGAISYPWQVLDKAIMIYSYITFVVLFEHQS